MSVKKLFEFLDSQKTDYTRISHSKAYTAQQTAATAHIPGKELAKTVIVKFDGKMVMVVLPASYKIDFDQLKYASGAKKVEMSSESEFRDTFDDCDLGAMPPFGNLYDMKVYVALSLAEGEEITFNACEHNELVKMKYKDFDRLVKPRILKFSELSQ